MSKNEFRTFIHEQEKDFRCESMKFYSLLVMPIQRIPRYILLLQRLCETTNSREEKFELQKVLSEMREITGLIESCIKDYENSEKLWLIQESLGLKSDIVSPGRRLIKEGVLYKRTHCGETSYYERMFWLFNDTLVYGKRRIGMGPKYECSCIYPLRHCVLDYNEMDGSLDIKCKGHSILVTSDSYAGLKSWYDEIKEAVERVKLLRSTLRKESSRQQVKEYKSNVKRQITKKFINKTYLYDLSNTLTSERLKVQKRKWARAATCSNDVNVMSSPLKSGDSSKKRRCESDFDNELMEAIRKRRLEIEGSNPGTMVKSEINQMVVRQQEVEIREIKEDIQNPDNQGIDMEDKRPRLRSSTRDGAKRRVERQLTRPEIRKYSYQEVEPSAPQGYDSDEDGIQHVNERYTKITSPPWWLQEAQPAEFAKNKENSGGFFKSFKESCAIM
ncbi:hypothetical protein WR25_01533 [Diploscapter pachys]|uniref:DH domain-containing protein n=1 Tax=Diploscapter pachys TaxID=2018661 RepID=A0A2A2J1M9_9BILA|nr:hypothetical protein WR25_01533 [Diploscapter pachys]